MLGLLVFQTLLVLVCGAVGGTPGALPANPPGYSTHELKSDGVAYSSIPRGRDLPWWGQGFDVDDAYVARVIAAAARHGWRLFRPFSNSATFTGAFAGQTGTFLTGEMIST